MTIKRITLILTMLVLAVFAIGAVSATDDIATDIEEPTDDIAIDDIAVDDDSVDETVEIQETAQTRTVTYTPMPITTNSDLDNISAELALGHYNGYQFNFENGTYTNFSMFTGNNTKFVGNGATIIGSSDNLFKIANSHNVIITGFNMQVATGKAAVYGANVNNTEIINNNITGGKDGINIMQTHDNITITGNRITNVTRDAISLVDHQTLSDDQWAERGYSTISNNIITGNCEFGMFFGGNFKGTIEDNVINGSVCGIEFAGKKAVTNGRLEVDIISNEMSNVQTGIDMYHPGVEYLYMGLNDIETLDNDTCFAIKINSNFAKVTDGEIWAYNNYLHGKINQTFINACNAFSGNYGYSTV